MVSPELFDAADAEAAHLAAAAGPSALLAGAADAEVGLAVLTDLLAHEIAAGHRIMLRLATAAHDVMDWTVKTAADEPAAGETGAARLAAVSGRLMEQVRLGLVLLRRLRPDAESEGVWLALGWGDSQCADEEFARRLAAAKAAKAANDPEPAKPTLSPRAQAVRAAADEQAAKLASMAGVKELAGVAADAAIGPAFLGRLFTHELGVAHALMMRLTGKADGAFERAKAAAQEPAHALALVNVAARLADRYRRGLASLARFAGSRDGTPKVAGYVWKGPERGPTARHGVLPSESNPPLPAAA